jgi:HSP20 family protein
MSWDEDFFKWYNRWRRSLLPKRFFEDFDTDLEEFDKVMQRMFSDIMEKVPKDLIKEKEMPDGTKVKQMGPIVYGYSMTIGPDGKPVIREFGNIKPSRRTTPFGLPRGIGEISQKREPLVDVISEDDIVKVIAEVPGVDKSDISLSSTEHNLTIHVDSEQRKYFKDVDLPFSVEPESAKASCKNGVLQVTLNRKKEKEFKGNKIRIE